MRRLRILRIKSRGLSVKAQSIESTFISHNIKRLQEFVGAHQLKAPFLTQSFIMDLSNFGNDIVYCHRFFRIKAVDGEVSQFL